MGNTIPASAFVEVNPAVLGPGGASLQLNGLFLDNSTRIPIGSVLSFASAANVGSYCGLASNQYAAAQVYFAGFTGANTRPGAMLISQYNQAAVPAYMRGGNVSSLTATQLEALAGTLMLEVNGVWETSGAINLSTDGTFSLAAAAIQLAFSSFVGIVTYDSVAGAFVFTTTATGASETITTAISGTGTSTTSTSSSTTLTIGGTITGKYNVGDVVVGTDGINSYPAGTTITAILTGTGGAGTYTTSAAAAPGDLTSTVVDSFGISGALATGLGLTVATGAILSQGADAVASPNAYMSALVSLTTAWASFTTMFDPDVSGNANKQGFAAWNTLQNNRYMYVPWDTDITPTESTDAASSLGQILIGNGNSGTALVYEPTNLNHAAFIAGLVASIDFTEINGNTSAGYKSQAGLTPSVFSQTVMGNLISNGYNSYVSVANANNQWQYLYPGSVTGPFRTIQRYANQIWMNSSFQTALMTLLTQVKAVPYVQAGYTLIEAACQDVINVALTFGMIQQGVTLGQAEIAEVNYAAVSNIAGTLQTRGWYLQVLDPGAVVRGNSGSPAIQFWYTDGGSVLSINMSSTDVI